MYYYQIIYFGNSRHNVSLSKNTVGNYDVSEQKKPSGSKTGFLRTPVLDPEGLTYLNLLNHYTHL